MTNTTFSGFHLKPRGEYLDLCTGQVSVVDKYKNCYNKAPEDNKSTEAMGNPNSLYKMLTHLASHSFK